MILDLHVHSTFSGDSPVTPEQYADRMTHLAATHDVDGFVLMEHNHLIDPDRARLPQLARDRGLVILAGVEVDTYWGHLLTYGLDPRLWKSFQDNGQRKQEPVAFAKAAAAAGAAIVPAHPFRWPIGMGEMCKDLHGVTALEGLNHGNDDAENQTALRFAAKMGWAATGGSDAHFIPELGSALTFFERPVPTMDALVAELKAGRCRPLTLEQARL